MTHPAKDLLIAIAEGKQMERNRDESGFWVPCDSYEALRVIGLGHPDEIRIARQMVERTVKYPEPLRRKPEIGERYWLSGPSYAKPINARWDGVEFDNRIFAAGMAFATEADAAEAHKALYGGGNE